jgi:hypothetical protein
MANKKVIKTYIPGQWNVICDRCGVKRKSSQVTMQMNKEQSNILVCTDTCLDKHQPQVDVRGIPDNTSVPFPRPGDGYAVDPLAEPFGYGSLSGPDSPLLDIDGNDQPDS